MVLESLIPIVIIALVVVFAWGLFKKFFKVIIYVGVAIILVIAGTTFMIYQDAKDLKKNFNPSEKKIILVENNEVLTGLLLGADITPISDSETTEFSSYLGNKDYDKILGDSYKLLIFDIKILDSLGDEIQVGDETVPKEEVIDMLRSEGNNGKAELFGIIVANEILSSQNPLLLFSGLKDGTVKVYEETALFKAVKLVPFGIIKNTASKLFEGAKEKTSLIIEEVE